MIAKLGILITPSACHQGDTQEWLDTAGEGFMGFNATMPSLVRPWSH